jgi:hypothetical protein
MLAYPIASLGSPAYAFDSGYRPGAGHCHQCSAMVLAMTGKLEQAAATTGSTTCEQRYAR